MLDSLKTILYLILLGRILLSDRIIVIWLTNISSKKILKLDQVTRVLEKKKLRS